MTGISVRRYIFAFALTGLVAGVSGIIFCSRLAGGYALGAMGWELDVITAVFLGGTSLTGGQGSILGTFLGVLIIGTLRNGMALAGIDIAAQNMRPAPCCAGRAVRSHRAAGQVARTRCQ
jgi:ribose transport system permease protein